MKEHPLIRACWFAVNAFLIVSLAAVLYSISWEFSTRSYLKGFSDAIIPASDGPEQKVEAILQWMAHGPARRTSAETSGLDARNPEETLNIERLLEVCGTATNAFVNLAQSNGLHARRLLLLDSHRSVEHVVVEVLIDGRWIVVDPAYRALFRRPDGRLVTAAELKDPATFRTVTQLIPAYRQAYSYETTSHIHLGRIPLVGKYLRAIFNFVWPNWEVAINWTLLVERESFAMLVASILMVCFALVARLLLGWYCASRLGIARVRLRDQLLRAGQMLVGSSS
ncbi:MAG TPA: transglutaminase-like domain-containing protein [Candidatus Acidoferrales bacterium]|nr:transglutaminase-like domain-containing protein [Candidatus Acidoferrales bacterium]